MWEVVGVWCGYIIGTAIVVWCFFGILSAIAATIWGLIKCTTKERKEFFLYIFAGIGLIAVLSWLFT